jgi:hypothetical protein
VARVGGDYLNGIGEPVVTPPRRRAPCVSTLAVRLGRGALVELLRVHFQAQHRLHVLAHLVNALSSSGFSLEEVHHVLKALSDLPLDRVRQQLDELFWRTGLNCLLRHGDYRAVTKPGWLESGEGNTLSSPVDPDHCLEEVPISYLASELCTLAFIIFSRATVTG